LGNVSEDDSPFVTSTRFGEKAYTKMRHFVVVREMNGCCLCLPLITYNGQGASKAGVRGEDYAAVYPVGGQPNIGDSEKLNKEPFPILVEEPTETIDPKSRINFGRVYTVEHNIKVLKVGRIPDEHLPRLDQYFIGRIATSGPTPQSSVSLPEAYAPVGAVVSEMQSYPSLAGPPTSSPYQTPHDSYSASSYYQTPLAGPSTGSYYQAPAMTNVEGTSHFAAYQPLACLMMSD
jgi:hypothetical protein